jgi:hypothetical protein
MLDYWVCIQKECNFWPNGGQVLLQIKVTQGVTTKPTHWIDEGKEVEEIWRKIVKQ